MSLELIGQFRDDGDGAEKYVFKDEDGILEISRVSASRQDREALCLPSMYSCGLACKFCHLTTQKIVGKNKRIAAERLNECVSQIELTSSKPNFLYCLMGIGDPLLNIPLIKDLHNRQYPENVSKRKGLIATSLATIIPTKEGMSELYKMNLPIKIHFSLHSTFDEKRRELVPKAVTSIKESLELLKDYKNLMDNNHKDFFYEFYKHHASVEIHYTLIDSVNDSDRDLENLKDILTYGIPIKFIKFNPTADLRSSPREEEFIETLNKIYPEMTRLHIPPGRNIGSSCGEFSKHFYHENLSSEEREEFEEYKRRFGVKKAI